MSSTLQALGRVYVCHICGLEGSQAQGGIRCIGCDLFFHMPCIDPVRETPIPTALVGGAPHVWACDDCADIIEDLVEQEDAGVNVEEYVRQILEETDSESSESYDTEDTESDDESDEDEDEEDDGCIEETPLDFDDFEDAEKTAEKLLRGEVVWSRNNCDCEVCREMNEVAVPETWQALCDKAEELYEDSDNLLLRSFCESANQSQAHADTLLQEILFLAHKPACTMNDIFSVGSLAAS